LLKTIWYKNPQQWAIFATIFAHRRMIKNNFAQKNAKTRRKSRHFMNAYAGL